MKLMQCDVCGKNKAMIFLTQIVDGKMQTINLCEACSREKGIEDPLGFELADILEGVGSAQNLEEEKLAKQGIRCPICGFTEADFKKIHRFGCSACYDTFYPFLQPELEKMHKGQVHVGKMPPEYQRKKEQEQHLNALQGQMAQAIEVEDYEEAARLRDQIIKLKAEGACKKLS